MVTVIQNIPGVIVGTAKDRKRGMTLGELVSFAQAAMSQGAPMDTTVACTSTWRNSIRRLEVPDGTPSDSEEGSP